MEISLITVVIGCFLVAMIPAALLPFLTGDLLDADVSVAPTPPTALARECGDRDERLAA